MRKKLASRQHELGFSLLEIVVVMTIVAMATAVAIPLIRKHDPLRSEVTTLTARLRALRSSALQLNSSTSMVIDPKGCCYATEPANSRIELARDVSLRGSRSGSAPSYGSGLTIVFYPDGSSTGGQVELVFDGRVCRVDVIALTGSVQPAGCTP